MESLDELYAAARRAMQLEKAKEAKQPKVKAPVAPPVEPQALFANPENWVRTRGVTLVHSRTQRLLGNFWEWKHKSVPGARKLVRSDAAIPTEGLEEVDFGLSADLAAPSQGGRMETEQNVSLFVQLDTPSVSATVELCVKYWNGWTASAVLLKPAVFAEGMQLLELPSGVDILPVMSRESKKALRP
jgi:hypothetical protein